MVRQSIGGGYGYGCCNIAGHRRHGRRGAMVCHRLRQPARRAGRALRDGVRRYRRSLAAARRPASEARQQAEAALGRKGGAVISLAENYPDLAASPHFRDLRVELVATEERVAAARRFFNLAVEEYNATRAQFPASLVASRRRLGERRPFDLGIDRVMQDEAVSFRFAAPGA